MAAVAGAWVRPSADAAPVPAGDALADPLTGLTAAVEALRPREADRVLVEVAMAGVIADALRAGGGAATPIVPLASHPTPGPHRQRPVLGPVAALGEHTARVLAELT
ncbi:hypothetical protein [Enemella dayhoffiae]|uniref:hypothetical protein n=1 Tax=Enemella dayhoffiae TaxID=2016507 RepID=UPI001E4A7D2F|nr:hypothetical protein [Enemella dayhoffiae]